MELPLDFGTHNVYNTGDVALFGGTAGFVFYLLFTYMGGKKYVSCSEKRRLYR